MVNRDLLVVNVRETRGERREARGFEEAKSGSAADCICGETGERREDDVRFNHEVHEGARRGACSDVGQRWFAPLLLFKA